MPVEMPVAEAPEAVPEPPRVVVWLGLFVICMLVGVATTLLTWPKTQPTHTAWFWVCLLIFPALAWCISFGLRLHYFDDETARLRAVEEALLADQATALQFAREPLAVLGCAYLSAQGNVDVASEIAEGGSILSSQTPHSGGKAIRHTALTLVKNEGSVGRYRSGFTTLLGSMANAINAVPRSVPFEVRLQLPVEADRALLLSTWRECWRDCEFRPAQASLLAVGQGLMVLDEWLDIHGGPELEKFVLLVSIQLHHQPPPGSAEAAVALLLSWEPLAVRRGLHPRVLLHRPVEDDLATLNDAVSRSLLWGKVEAEQVSDLWQAGLSEADKPALVKASSDLALSIAQTSKLSGIHDIDVAIGDAGAAAGWLAVAMAVEHATTTGKAQWIASRESTLRLAIVQPATRSNDVEQG